ncbi:MAG: hypothetical protein Q4F13_06885 [Pseudomonadota bacterium]|nr:hypothetical protein [Pseudomonadota bacterium]
MTFEQRLIALATAIGADIKLDRLSMGPLPALGTSAKGSLVAAINELKSGLDAIVASPGGVAIDDTAGNGATTVTWSADKIYDTIELAKTAVKNELTDGAAAALDTLNELATALGNDANYAQTVATALGKRVRVDEAQTLTPDEKAQARSNIGAVAAEAIGNPDADLVAVYNAAKA